MSDSFADLWNISAPLPAKPKPQTLSAAAATASSPAFGQGTSKKPDVFSLLAASSSSLSVSNINRGSGVSLSRPITPTVFRSHGSTPVPSQPTKRDNGDAFADLLSGSSTTNKSANAGMTLAARLAMEAEENNKGYCTTTLGVQSHKSPDEAWVGLDSLEGGISHLKTNMSKVKVDDDDDWGFGSVAQSSSQQKGINPKPSAFPPTTKPPSTSKTLWDLDDFSSSIGSTTTTTTVTTTTTAPPPASSLSSGSYLKTQSLPVSRSTSRLSDSSSQTHQPKVDSPDLDFDFGSREDRDQDQEPTHTRTFKSSGIDLLDDNNNDNDHLMSEINHGHPQETEFFTDIDDVASGGTAVAHDEDEADILGLLSKPVEAVIAKKKSDFDSSRTSTTPSWPTPPISAPPSPPPHILGQIVEMGFSVSQAKKALAATADGKDVQAALESLLNGSGASNAMPSTQAQSTPPPLHPKVRGPPRGQKERERERKDRESQRAQREDAYTGSGSTTAADIQDQADKFLLQASEIGLSVLSRASAFWKEGKEKVVKVMEERAGFDERAKGKNTDGRPRMDGRPKWMKEVVNDEDAGDEFGEEYREEYGEGFKNPGPSGGFESAEVDLFSSDPIPTHAPASVTQLHPSFSQHPSQPHTQTHARPPPHPRTIPTASSSTLSLASSHKNTGTSQFKLGQYGPASDSYTSAITLLPPGHLLLVPLYTNRSLARLRCGEYLAAGEDAGEALKIICVADPNANANVNLSSGTEDGNVIWNPDMELPELIQGGREKVNEGGWSDSRGVGIDLVDGYIKALRRRAEAWEGREKWVEAGKDWEVLAGGGGGASGGWIGEGIRREAVRGAGRCRKMASGQEGSSSSSSSASKPPLPKPKPRSSPPPPSQPSQALLAHQATTLQADADDTLKHQLKDSVDARISAWKKGKETNIRALLASLDMVLWDDILMKGGGVKVNGLGELVTDVQVKKGYVRAISKVHPDKLNASNSTVEQRMLANSVFAALNEAWIAFQGGNG